jgi:hypothetical protein
VREEKGKNNMTNIVEQQAAFIIDRDVPLPPTQKGPQNLFGMALKRMAVGESLLVPPTTSRGNLSATCGYWTNKVGFKFAVRRRHEDTDHEVGFRVWRIE